MNDWAFFDSTNWRDIYATYYIKDKFNNELVIRYGTTKSEYCKGQLYIRIWKNAKFIRGLWVQSFNNDEEIAVLKQRLSSESYKKIEEMSFSLERRLAKIKVFA